MKRLRMATKLGLAIIPIALIALAAGALVARNALETAESEERASLAARVAADAMESLVAFSAEHAVALEVAVGTSDENVAPLQSATDEALLRLSDSVAELTPRASGNTSGIVAAIAGDSSRVRSTIERLRAADPTEAETAETVAEVGRRLISVVTQSTFYLGNEARAREGEGAVALARASFASLQEELLIVQNEVGQFFDDEDFARQMLVPGLNPSPTTRDSPRRLSPSIGTRSWQTPPPRSWVESPNRRRPPQPRRGPKPASSG